MKQLWWIVTSLPAEEEYQLRNSRTLAVQLRALYAMLKITNDVPLWAKSHTNPSSDPLSNTARYYEEEKNKLVYFVSNLAQHIKQYYIKYDTARPYLPSNMLLLVSEEELLLSYCIAEERRQYKGTNFIYSGVVALRYLEHFLEQEGKVYWSEQRHYLVKDSFAIEPFSWVAWFNTLNTKERDHFDSVFSKELNETALNKLNPYMPYPCLLEQCGSYFQLALSPTDEKTSSKIVEFCNNVIPLYAKKDDSNRQRDCAFLLVAEIMWALLHSKLTADFFAQEKGIDFVKNTAKWSRENNTTIPKIKCFILNTGHNTIQYKIKKKTVSVKESFKPEEFISNPSFIPEPMTKVYNSLIEIENTYKNKENELIEAIGKLENSFTNKEEQLKKLSDHFLKIEADKQTAINHFFEEEVDHVFFKVLLDPSISKKTVVSINNIKNTIKLCIESRAVNLTELTQTKAIPNLEDLLRYEYQSLDFISMGIEENLACQLPQEIIKLRHLLVFQERLTRIQHAGTEYAQKKNPQKAMALASALLHLNMPEKKQQVLFEYMNQLVLRPEQKRFMALFSKKDEQQRSKVLQLVMGGGKTKVILPLWAFETANSDSLAVILVPELALQVNFNDLSSTSLHSFNQKAHCLRFDRSTPSDPASLQALYEKLQIIRTEKDYIVSTASSVQSLELKYLEILKQQVDGKQDSAGEFKLYWLNKILTLIQKKGVVAIDEAHKVLHIKKELNYAIDKVSPIDTEVAQLMIELYMWLGEHAPEIKNYAVDPSEVMKDEKISQFMNKCLKLLLEKPPYWLLRASENNVMELEKYIKGSTISTDEQKKLDANPQKKRLWTVLREQFQVLLPATLRRKLYEHYGPSPESGIRYAIPYRANNAPTSFVFGNILETINYTIQMMMYQGVTTKQFQFLLSEWKKEALEDNREESLVQKKFEIIFGVGYRSLLAALDCNKVEVLEQFKKQFAHHPILLREVITPVIHQLSSEKKVLSSNPINLINQFYQVLAVTGTPQNHRTYASNIKMIYESRLGGDATVIGYITNKSTLKDCDSASQMQFIIKLLEEQGTEKQIQAIIDFGGFFIGKSNKDMAPLFMETYEKRPNYVLYYEEDSLYAYGKNTPCKSLHSTNPAYLTEELHCSPLERVTYYDQEHTLGSDIAQDEKACAIVTVDVLTAKLSEFLQAVMRMRGLGNNQSLIIVSNKKMLNIAQLIECLRKNEEKQLQEDIFHAGIKKIDDAFRNHLLMKLKNELDFNKRNEIFNITQSLFIHEEVDRTFLEAASISEVFQTYYKGNKKKWADVIDETLFPEELIQAIIHQTSQDCETLKLNHSLFLGQEIQQYREQQVEVHKEKELLLETVAQRINLISIQTDWVTSYLKERSPTLPEKWQLSKIIHSQYPDIKFAINTNLYASKNFLFTYETQQEFYSAYTKPGVSILFIWKENVLHGVLLCGEEAESAHKIITTKSLTHCFLMTLEGYAYGPTPFPEHSLQIKELLEQAQLLTGHIQSLLSNELSDWVAKDLQEKIAFLEKNGTFLNSNKQQIIRLLNRYVQLEPYVDEWHLSNAETNNFLDYLANKRLPKPLLLGLNPF
ncbi:DUF3638 domain-containing protein [Legionella feeleii]|uniref:Protein of uncharacterized function (DUF3638) n=1 Tax=Legionella feeleii TaxID=453 RepID=A0A2X1QPS0_9GAMM|nr:DUF3638 domain-containing protein [Legionella feeleii]SPX60116.1 Protein of uncharacterised function (DUF3638) [Legionella feeleii]